MNGVQCCGVDGHGNTPTTPTCRDAYIARDTRNGEAVSSLGGVFSWCVALGSRREGGEEGGEEDRHHKRRKEIPPQRESAGGG